jgi:hypothetical protein
MVRYLNHKQKIHARQGGHRQGEVWCEIKEDRVFLQGTCQFYMEGFIFIPQILFGASYES